MSSDRVRLSNKIISMFKINEAVKSYNTEIDTNSLARFVEEPDQSDPVKNNVYYTQTEIAFCGKNKDNKKFFALL